MSKLTIVAPISVPNHGELKMNVLVIENLSVEEEMDRTAMADVTGGRLPMAMNTLIGYVDCYTHNGFGDERCYGNWETEAKLALYQS